VDLVPVPGSNPLQRIVKAINIYNADTVNATVTVRYNNNTALRSLCVVTLSPGDTLTWTASSGWCVTNSAGQIESATAPLAHATSHVTGGTDVIANAVAAGNAGLMTGADKTILNNAAPLASPSFSGTVSLPAVVGPPSTVTVTHTTQALPLTTSTIEIVTDGDSDVDVASLANGTAGQEMAIYIKSNGNAADSFTLSATFADGSSTFAFGAGAKGHGIYLIYTSAGWVIVSLHMLGDANPAALGAAAAGTAVRSSREDHIHPTDTTHAALNTGVHGLLGSVRVRDQVTPTALTAAATVTIAQLLTGIITGNPAAAAAYTLPTGTLCEGGLTIAVDEAFDWVLINIAATATYIITLTAGVGHTIVGAPAIQAASATTGGLWGTASSIWRTRKTALNTFVTYRIA
jgi:hypothetical protein